MADEQTLNHIMNEYEELRISAANERKKRIEKVNKKIPRVAEIDREIFQCGMENTKRIFKNPDKADEYNRDFKENLRKLENEKSNLLKVNGISADYNKYKYENSKKQKENKKKQREANLDIKEYRLSVTIDVHDFNTRVRNSLKYLEKGHKVKVSVRFKGREMAHTELGREVLERFADALKEVSDVEQKPKMDGRFMTMMLIPKKEK